MNEEILKELIENITKYDTISDNFSNTFVFQEKTLAEWLDDLAIPIPKDMTPENFRDSFILWAKKMQKASYYYSIASTLHTALSNGSDNKKSQLVAELLGEYQASIAKRPAATTLERLADAKLKETLSHQLAAKILKEFWRDRRDTLIEVRKALEAIGISMNMEMKYHENV